MEFALATLTFIVMCFVEKASVSSKLLFRTRWSKQTLCGCPLEEFQPLNMTGPPEAEAATGKNTPHSVITEFQDFERISKIVLRSATISIEEPSSVATTLWRCTGMTTIHLLTIVSQDPWSGS
jgi:hypothetical protein